MGLIHQILVHRQKMHAFMAAGTQQVPLAADKLLSSLRLWDSFHRRSMPETQRFERTPDDLCLVRGGACAC